MKKFYLSIFKFSDGCCYQDYRIELDSLDDLRNYLLEQVRLFVKAWKYYNVECGVSFCRSAEFTLSDFSCAKTLSFTFERETNKPFAFCVFDSVFLYRNRLHFVDRIVEFVKANWK